MLDVGPLRAATRSAIHLDNRLKSAILYQEFDLRGELSFK